MTRLRIGRAATAFITRLYPALDFPIELVRDRTDVIGREALERHAKTASLQKENWVLPSVPKYPSFVEKSIGCVP